MAAGLKQMGLIWQVGYEGAALTWPRKAACTKERWLELWGWGAAFSSALHRTEGFCLLVMQFLYGLCY